MGHSNNRESRRFWKSTSSNRARVPCESCGATARTHSTNPPMCDMCFAAARHGDLAQWDELNAGE